MSTGAVIGSTADPRIYILIRVIRGFRIDTPSEPDTYGALAKEEPCNSA